jgi:hypothetical protein
MMSGCIARSCAPVVVVLPFVEVDVDLSSNLEVQFPLEIPAILRPRLLNLGFPIL